MSRRIGTRKDGTALVIGAIPPNLKLLPSNRKHLSLLAFDQASKEWLRYVSAYRTDKSASDSYDIVIGPVANDQAIRTINDFLKGRFTEDIAIQLLLPQNLKDQYAFKTEKAISILELVEVKYL